MSEVSAAQRAAYKLERKAARYHRRQAAKALGHKLTNKLTRCKRCNGLFVHGAEPRANCTKAVKH
jgi:hypothetical protein